MRIGADGSFLRWRRTGVARYLDCMLHALADQLPSADDLIVYYNATEAEPLFGPSVRERFVRMQTATLWNQMRLPIALRGDDCDVYLGGAHVVPTHTRVPTVVVVHDCLSFRFPESKSRRDGAYLRRWTRRSAQRSQLVICDSNWGAQEAQSFLDLEPEKIRVIPLAADPSFTAATDDDVARQLEDLRKSHGLESPYVLQVGGFELHKGGSTAVQAVELLRRRGHDVTLVRCGIPGPHQQSSAHTLDVGFVDEETLHALYQCATVACVASTHEGFGLPVLEAMASGVPVVAARTAAIPEVGGDVALYAEPGEPETFADAMATVLEDPGERERRRAAGLRRAASYNWHGTAAAMLEVVREVADKPPRTW